MLLRRFLEQNSSANRIILDFSKEILKEIKSLYKTNELKKIGNETLDNLKYAYNVAVMESFQISINWWKFGKPQVQQIHREMVKLLM